MSRIRSKIESTRKDLDRKRKERNKHANEIKELQKGIQDLTAKLDGLREKGLDGGKKIGDYNKDELEGYCRV